MEEKHMWTLPLALQFLKANWIPVVIGVACLALMGYIGVLHLEINHYKSEVVALQLEKKAAAAKTAQLEANAENITKMYHESLANQFKLQDAAGTAVHERIVKNEASKHVILDSDIVGLFNSSKPSLKLKDTTNPIKGNAGRPSSIEEDPRYADEAPLAYEHTLNELLDISAYNDSNHLKCIGVVHEWQNFWKDYTESYGAVSNAP
jgi:hypothetical protein